MKKFINIITSKKAMIVMLVIACIVSVLDVVDSIRNNTPIDFALLGAMFASIAVWADSCCKKQKKAVQQ